MDLERDQDNEYNFFPQYEKQPYGNVFHAPGPDWRVEAVWDEAYFRAAKTLIEGVACGDFLPAIEGVAGLYLFRHYIELALKYIIFHSRWLKDSNTNATNEEIQDVQKGHSLKAFWRVAERECQRVISEREWKALDIEFVNSCINEFDAIDPSGERFRYHGEKFGIERDPAKRQQLMQSRGYDLYVDFRALVSVVQHVWDVLHYLDVFMIETCGQNDEWQGILDSY